MVGEAVDGPAVDDAAAVEEVVPVATVARLQQGAPVPMAGGSVGARSGVELLDLVVEGVLEGTG